MTSRTTWILGSIVPTVSSLAAGDICTNLGGRLELHAIVKDIEGKGDHTVATWILVSDTSRAKLFSAEKREDDWMLLKDFEHPEGRKLSKDISPSAPPGRMQQSEGLGARRTSMEPHTWPKEASAERFAELLAHYLEEALGTNAFDALVLVAPPHFLGMLGHWPSRPLNILRLSLIHISSRPSGGPPIPPIYLYCRRPVTT